jgi:hypothetical protein
MASGDLAMSNWDTSRNFMAHNEAQAGSAAEITRLSKFQKITLRTIILIQMAHTLLMPLITMYALTENVPPDWLWTLAWVLALLVEIALLRSFSQLPSWVWICTLLILVDACVYAVHDFLNFGYWLTRSLDAALLVAVPFGFAALWLSRKAFSIDKTRQRQATAAIILAMCVVSMNGYFFSSGGLDWLEPVPIWYAILYHVHETVPQEAGLTLGWACYAAVAAFVWVIAMTRRRAGR